MLARWSVARLSVAQWSVARWTVARLSVAQWSVARWTVARLSVARWSVAVLAKSQSVHNHSIGRFRGGPSRLRPPLLATDRRRHCTPDKWQRYLYCVMATCSSEYSKWLPPVAFSQLYKAQKFVFGWGSAPDPAGELTVLPQTLYSWFKLIFSQL